jgi:hypothetical protein
VFVVTDVAGGDPDPKAAIRNNRMVAIRNSRMVAIRKSRMVAI